MGRVSSVYVSGPAGGGVGVLYREGWVLRTDVDIFAIEQPHGTVARRETESSWSFFLSVLTVSLRILLFHAVSAVINQNVAPESHAHTNIIHPKHGLMNPAVLATNFSLPSAIINIPSGEGTHLLKTEKAFATISLLQLLGPK